MFKQVCIKNFIITRVPSIVLSSPSLCAFWSNALCFLIHRIVLSGSSHCAFWSIALCFLIHRIVLSDSSHCAFWSIALCFLIYRSVLSVPSHCAFRSIALYLVVQCIMQFNALYSEWCHYKPCNDAPCIPQCGTITQQCFTLHQSHTKWNSSRPGAYSHLGQTEAYDIL